MRPIPSHRPANPAQIARDMQIQFVLEVLNRIGIKPNGSFVSGCRIVAEVLGIPEETVRRIWKERVQKAPFVHVMQKQMKGIAERNEPFHTTGGLNPAQARVRPVSLSGSGLSLQISVTRGPPHGHGLLETTGLSAGAFASCASARHDVSRNC